MLKQSTLHGQWNTLAGVSIYYFLVVAGLPHAALASKPEAASNLTTVEPEVDWLGDRLAAMFSLQDWSEPHGLWSKRETASFLIHVEGASESELEGIATACEACLATILNHWQQETSWSPKCIVVLHRTPESYERTLGQRAGRSWGCTTIRRSGARVTLRRIDICATTPKRLAETFPHELTHVFLADCFGAHSVSVPRWLDEGLAVLAEPASKFARRVRCLRGEFDGGPFLRTVELFSVEHYPKGKRRDAFYVESAELVHMLLQRGGLQRLICFAETGAQNDYSEAARRHYGLASLAEIDWQRQETAAAGLFVQASRERTETDSPGKPSSPVEAGFPLLNVSYRQPITPRLPAPGE